MAKNDIVPKALDGEVLPPAKWRLQGFDTFNEFEGDDAFYDIPGEYDTEAEVRAAAERQYEELKKTQPDHGLRDTLYIIDPNGNRSRFWPADTPDWVRAANEDMRRAGF